MWTSHVLLGKGGGEAVYTGVGEFLQRLFPMYWLMWGRLVGS